MKYFNSAIRGSYDEFNRVKRLARRINGANWVLKGENGTRSWRPVVGQLDLIRLE